MIFMNIQSNEVVMENLNKQVNNYLTTWGFFFPVFSCCTQGGDKPYEDLAKYGYKDFILFFESPLYWKDLDRFLAFFFKKIITFT